MVHKAEIISTLYNQYYLFLVGMLAFAFAMGWKIGKDIDIGQITTSVMKNGFLYLLSQYQLTQD